MNLQTGLRSNKGSVPEKSQFSDRGGLKGLPPYLKGLKLSFIAVFLQQFDEKVEHRNRVNG